MGAPACGFASRAPLQPHTGACFPSFDQRAALGLVHLVRKLAPRVPVPSLPRVLVAALVQVALAHMSSGSVLCDDGSKFSWDR